MANTVVQEGGMDPRFLQLGAGLVQAGLEWGLGKRAQEERERAAKAQEEAEARRQTEVERAQKSAEFLKLVMTQAASTGTSLGDFLASNPLAHKELLTTSGFAPEAVAEQLKFAQDHPYTAAEQMNGFASRLFSGSGAAPTPETPVVPPTTQGKAEQGKKQEDRSGEVGAGGVSAPSYKPMPGLVNKPVSGAIQGPLATDYIEGGSMGGIKMNEGASLGAGPGRSLGPGGFLGSPEIPAATPAPRTLPTEEAPYIVKPGDTPAGIARALGVGVSDVLAAAGISDPTKLQIGAEIRIRRGQAPTTAETLEGVKTKLNPAVQGKLSAEAQKFEDKAAEAASSGNTREFLRAMKGFERFSGRILSSAEARELEKTEGGPAFLDAQVRAKLADPAWRAAYATTSPEARATMEALGREADPIWNALRTGQLDLLAKGAALDLEKAGMERAQATALVKAVKEIAKGEKTPEQAKIDAKILELDAEALNKIIGDYKGKYEDYSSDPGYRAVWDRFKISYKNVTGVEPPEPPPNKPNFIMELLRNAGRNMGLVEASTASTTDSEALKKMRNKVLVK